ncbi:MAG: hypothetical protein E4H33_03380 [Anaerolineales bacterium]|nr:MAG: hypothetical protein E4H33_03380 [Anaerolineales bacterium]
MLAQILVEGFRWQLWPLFIAVFTLITLSNIKRQFRGQGLVAGLAILFCLTSLLGGFLFPVPDPYPITGPYQIGTRVMHFVDPNRLEIYGSEPNAPREFMAQVWYPAVPGEKDQQAQWMPDIEFAGPAIANILDLPAFALDHLKYVQANAYLEAAPAPAPELFPVLIFSHGWEGFKEQNIFQVEELASQGYVVIGINHTYGAVLTVFPDGRQLPTNQQALPDGVSDSAYALASNLLVKQWAGDIGWALDELENLNQGSGEWFLKDRLDFNEIGIFGHSTGAGAAIEFCLLDERCQAALAMDLWAEPLSPEILELSLGQPALIMHSENWDSLDTPDWNYGLIGTLVEKAGDDLFEMTIKGTKHYDFSSLPLLSPLTVNLGLKGPINGDLVLEIINAESVAFFDRYLKGDETVNLEHLSQAYPEVFWGMRP